MSIHILALNSTTIVWGGLLLLLIVLAVLTVVFKKRREDVWKTFAKKHNCQFQTTEEGPRIAGRYSGHPFVFLISADSSDTGPMAIEEVRLVMTFHDSKFPADIQIHSATGFVGELQRSLEENRVPLEDETFDQNLVVTSEDPEAVKQSLTENCQNELLSLVQTHPEVNLSVYNGEAAMQTRTSISEISQLEEMFESLSKVVDCMLASHGN